MDWQLTFTLSSLIISMITATGALIISYKVYKRQKSIENENHFFRYKMEQYHIIIQSASALLDEYHDAFLGIKEELNERYLDQNILNELAAKIDDQTDEFRHILSKHSAFLPEYVVLKLDNFFNHLYDESQVMNTDVIKLEMMDTIMYRLDKYENDLEEITNLMRKDLGIESIDRRLKARTHK